MALNIIEYVEHRPKIGPSTVSNIFNKVHFSDGENADANGRDRRIIIRRMQSLAPPTGERPELLLKKRKMEYANNGNEKWPQKLMNG